MSEQIVKGDVNKEGLKQYAQIYPYLKLLSEENDVYTNLMPRANKCMYATRGVDIHLRSETKESCADQRVGEHT